MRLEWDERKNSQNIQKHGFDFSDAEELFTGLYPLLVAADEDYGEERWRGIGMIQGRIVIAVFTERGPNVIRLISLRKANQTEQKEYEKAIKDELGTH